MQACISKAQSSCQQRFASRLMQVTVRRDAWGIKVSHNMFELIKDYTKANDPFGTLLEMLTSVLPIIPGAVDAVW